MSYYVWMSIEEIDEKNGKEIRAEQLMKTDDLDIADDIVDKTVDKIGCKNREHIIAEMVDEDIQDIKKSLNKGDTELISKALTKWRPYKRMTTDELIKEYTDRR